MLESLYSSRTTATRKLKCCVWSKFFWKFYPLTCAHRHPMCSSTPMLCCVTCPRSWRPWLWWVICTHLSHILFIANFCIYIYICIVHLWVIIAGRRIVHAIFAVIYVCGCTRFISSHLGYADVDTTAGRDNHIFSGAIKGCCADAVQDALDIQRSEHAGHTAKVQAGQVSSAIRFIVFKCINNCNLILDRYKKVASIETIELSEPEIDDIIKGFKAAELCPANELPGMHLNSKVNLFYKF